MPIRDSGGNIEFGVRITADNEAFVDGVKASREELDKLVNSYVKTSDASDIATKAQDVHTVAIFKGVAAVEILRRAWDGAVGIFHEVVDTTLLMQQSQARLEAVLHATGGAAGQSAEGINKFADGLSRVTAFDDSSLKRAATTLLTFNNITGNTFERILKLSADLAATGRGDLETWVTVLAKAGTEPAEALGLVERSLGKLRPALKVAIQDAADFNNKQLATRLLLDEVAARAGGTAVESYRGLERQLDGTAKAWTRLKKAVGTEVFNANTRSASIFEQALDHMTETFKSRVAAMKDAWNSIPYGVKQMLGLMSGVPLAAAIVKGPDTTLEGLLRAREVARQYDGSTTDLDRQIALARAAAARATSGQRVDEFEGAGLSPTAAANAELLTTRQRWQLRDQDLQNLNSYLGVVYQMRANETNRELALEEFRRKIGIDTEDEYVRRVGALREQMARDDVARIQSSIAVERQRLDVANADLTRAKATEKPDEILAAETKVREAREKVKELALQEADAQARVTDAVDETGRGLSLNAQKRQDAIIATNRGAEDFLRNLEVQTDQMKLQQDLLGASPNEIQKTNIAQQLNLKFLEEEIRLRRQIEDLRTHGGDPKEIAAKEAAIDRLRVGTAKAIGEQQAIVDRNMQSTMSYYANAAGLAKGFFEQNTEGYRILEKTETAFRMVEKAMELEAFLMKQGFLVSWLATDTAVKGTAAATDKAFTGQSIISSGLRATADGIAAFAKTLASVPFPYNIAAGAAVLGLLAAVGVRLGGGGGGAGAVSSDDRQRTQGTGTVLGDAAAKTNSIERSLEIIRNNTTDDMPVLSDMATSLRSIDAQFAGVAALIARNLGIALGQNTAGLGLGKSPSALSSILGTGFPGGNLAPFAQTLVGAIFGTVSRSLADSGIQINAQTVGAARQGFSGSSYADVTTNRRALFGLINSSSTDRSTSALPDDVAHSFTTIVDSMVRSISSAVEILGGDGKAVEQLLNSLKIDPQSLSLKGLKGDEIKTALEAVFGKMGDDMATAALPIITEFQHVGEGAFETLIRVAQGVQTAKAALDLFGVAMVKWQDLTNKSGDVAVELIRQSLVATETINGTLTGVGEILQAFDGTAQDMVAIYRKLLDIRVLIRAANGDSNSLSAAMITAAGGLTAFQRALDSYNQNFFTQGEQVVARQKELATGFARLGIAMPTSAAGFRALVDSIDTSTEAGQRFYGAVIALAPAFADVTNSVQSMVASMYQAAAGLSSSFGSQYANANLQQAAQNWLNVSGNGNGWNVQQVIQEIAGLIGGGTSSNPGGFADALAYVQSLGPKAVEAFNALLNAYSSWQQSMQGAAAPSGPISTFTGGVDDAARALEELAKRTADAKSGIAEWLSGLFLDKNLSPLTPSQRKDYAHDQYVENLLKAQGGDIDALSNYTKFAQAYLTELRGFYGSGSEYLQGLAGVTEQGKELAGLSSGRPPTAGDLSSGFESVVEAIERLRDAVGQGHSAITGVIVKTSQQSSAALATAVRDGALTFDSQ